MVDKIVCGCLAGAAFSSLFVIPFGKTWLFIAFVAILAVALARLN